MYDIWSGDNGLQSIKTAFSWDVAIDNWVFRLHYIATTLIFIAYSILVTMNTYAGDPIDCQHGRNEDWGDFMDSFCFLHGTNSVYYPRDRSKGFMECLEDQEDCTKSHPQYMWVALMVLIQGGISYIPYYLWYGWEGGRMKQLLEPLTKAPKFLVEESTDLQANKCKCGEIKTRCQFDPRNGPHVWSSGNKLTEELATTYLSSLGDNHFYSLKHGVSEWLCLIVCCLQIYLTDIFLNATFMKYGQEVVNDLSKDPFERNDHMERTFPIVTSCTLPKYGTGGRGELTHAICVLPNNVVHQKFYLFLWFWLLSLTLVTFLHQVYRVCLLLVPSFRVTVTRMMWRETEEATNVDSVVEKIVAGSGYSDWILLSLFHTNLTAVNFQNFLQDLAFNYKEKTK